MSGSCAWTSQCCLMVDMISTKSFLTGGIAPPAGELLLRWHTFTALVRRFWKMVPSDGEVVNAWSTWFTKLHEEGSLDAVVAPQ